MKLKLPWELFISKLRKDTSLESTASSNNWLGIDDNRHQVHPFDILLATTQIKGSNCQNSTKCCRRGHYALMQAGKLESALSDILFSTVQFISIKIFNRFVAFVFLPIAISGNYYLAASNSVQPSFIPCNFTLTGRSKVIQPEWTDVWLHFV
jgi:hypothetical protein